MKNLILIVAIFGLFVSCQKDDCFSDCMSLKISQFKEDASKNPYPYSLYKREFQGEKSFILVMKKDIYT